MVSHLLHPGPVSEINNFYYFIKDFLSELKKKKKSCKYMELKNPLFRVESLSWFVLKLQQFCPTFLPSPLHIITFVLSMQIPTQWKRQHFSSIMKIILTSQTSGFPEHPWEPQCVLLYTLLWYFDICLSLIWYMKLLKMVVI